MMGGVWTVARQTFSQCLRTRVAAVFTVLLAASLVALPALMEGDGTLAGRVRTFLDYAFSVTSVLLSLVVILLSVGLVSRDVRDKHVFLVCVKPLGRWQYVLGRWLGVVLLSAVLLGGASAGIYVLAQYLRGRSDLAIRPEDRRAVESEVFTTRRQIAPKPVDVDEALAARIRQKKAGGTWDETVEAYKINFQTSQTRAVERLIKDLRSSVVASAQSVGPGRPLQWDFTNIHVVGRPVQRGGVARSVLRQTGLMTVQTDPDLVSRLVIFGPVWVKGVVGRVMGIGQGVFRASFHLEDMRSEQLSRVVPGSPVEVVVEPTIQISYKVSAADRKVAGALQAAWKIENPTTGFVYDVPPQEVPLRRQATLIAPARAVDARGNLRVRYFNYSRASVTVLHDDLAVLYEVGWFETNFAKTVVLTFMGLMFLAALGVFAGCALSFPVGCLVCFVMLWISTTLRFLTEAISSGLDYPGQDMVFLFYLGDFLLKLMRILLPDLVSTLATDFIVRGVEITWAYLGRTAALTVALRAVILLALACWVFRRRELARVQV